MKLNGEINNMVVVGGGHTPRTATINGTKLAKLQYMLTHGLYSDRCKRDLTIAQAYSI